MPSIYQLKPAFQKLLRPIVNLLAKMGISPNQITVLAIVLSIAAGAWVYYSSGSQTALLCIPILLFVRMALKRKDKTKYI